MNDTTDPGAGGADFGAIAPHYVARARVQQRAAAQLFDLLGIGPHDAVLDLGCGPGHLTAKIRELTDGPVTGVDAAAGMIGEARRVYAGHDIAFRQASAAGLDDVAAFDRIFCNSALQWMKPAEPALAACHRALRPGGRMAVQAPATARYCPNFARAMERVARDRQTGPIFARFVSPWTLLESAQDYRALFEGQGFKVAAARMEMAMAGYAAGEALGVFDSGAAAAYLNPDCYPMHLPRGYAAAVRRIVHDALTEQATDGRVDLVFHRVYLLAEKP
ncbi:MAG: methyltransferase domain-containing protein [Nitrospirae bacterium]|nr:methyltransferase domain-containing protein [Nitrospirota bacterium]